jgi:Rod binding domain-containing protein
MPIDAVGATGGTMTADQQKALSNLHTAAQQFEGVFIGMLFREMRKGESEQTLTGDKSQTEKIFTEMLDDRRADSIAQSGAFGLARLLESQLRAAVLANAAGEAQTSVQGVKR